jgi:hypothetical protein
MALKGIFTVNDADYSPLLMYGIGTFMAYSGNREYRNRGDALQFQTTSQYLMDYITSLSAQPVAGKV